MKRSRLRKWLIGLGIAAAILGVGAFVAFDRITDYMLRSVASNISFDTEGTVGSVQSGTTEDAGNASTIGKPVPIVGGNGSGLDPLVATPTPKSMPQPAITSENKDFALLVTPKASGTPASSSPQPTPYHGEVTKEKADQAQEQITVKDKALVASILLKKLSPSDLQLFTQMMSGGMTLDEKKQAKQLILGKLSEDEYNQLIAIAAKLGLSQGENYQDSWKDFAPSPSPSASVNP